MQKGATLMGPDSFDGGVSYGLWLGLMGSWDNESRSWKSGKGTRREHPGDKMVTDKFLFDRDKIGV